MFPKPDYLDKEGNLIEDKLGEISWKEYQEIRKTTNSCQNYECPYCVAKLAGHIKVAYCGSPNNPEGMNRHGVCAIGYHLTDPYYRRIKKFAEDQGWK